MHVVRCSGQGTLDGTVIQIFQQEEYEEESRERGDVGTEGAILNIAIILYDQ